VCAWGEKSKQTACFPLFVRKGVNLIGQPGFSAQVAGEVFNYKACLYLFEDSLADAPGRQAG